VELAKSSDLTKKGVFDLRAVLAEQQQPEDTITFYIDREVGHAANKLEKRIKELENSLAVANLQKDDKVIKQATDALNSATDKLEELYREVKPYKATIRAITRRAKHDLQSKALHAFPIRRDVWGNDDSEQEFARGHYLELLVWSAMIRSIESPDGDVQEFSGEDTWKVMEGIHDALPESAANRINAAIDAIMDDGEEFEFATQNEDFS
jgi:prefoldin subunit 5